jgi:hypothetical protein
MDAETRGVMWIYQVGRQQSAALQPTGIAKVLVVNEIGSPVERVAAYGMMLLPSALHVNDKATEHARAASHMMLSMKQSDAQRSRQ